MSVFRPLLASALVFLGGCAAEGVKSDGNFPTLTFPVQTDFQAASRRANEFIRVCHTDVQYAYGLNYQSNNSYDERTATGTLNVYKRTEPAKLLEVIKVRPDGPVNTARYALVTVTVFGDEPFDQNEIDAARKSIESATPSCREGAGNNKLPLLQRTAPRLQGVSLPDAGNN